MQKERFVAMLDGDPQLMEKRTQIAKRLEFYKSARDEIDAVASKWRRYRIFLFSFSSLTYISGIHSQVNNTFEAEKEFIRLVCVNFSIGNNVCGAEEEGQTKSWHGSNART